jgi:hypothetical protein
VGTVSETTPQGELTEWTPPATLAARSAMSAIGAAAPTTGAAPTAGAAARAAGAPGAGGATSAARAGRLVALMRTALSGLVPRATYQLTRLGPAGVVGAAASAAAVVAIFTLLSLQAANNDLTTQILQAQHRHAAPITPEQGLTQVVAQLPTRAQMPAVLGQVFQQARAAGVELVKGQYSYSPTAKGGVGRYELQFPVTAQYPAVRDFINRTLTNIPAAGLHKLTIQRKVVGEPQVNADVRFVIFIRDR